MSKKLLLLVHGMGKPTHEIFNQWKETLKKVYEQYSKGESFEDRFDCINIEYDSIFEKLRNNWNNQIDSILNSGVTGVKLPDRDDLSVITEDNLLTTHIQDVLLYRFVPQVAEHVRVHVIDQFINAIKAADSSAEISIIAHSLGTSVIHDAVNAMYNIQFDNGKTLSPGNFRFHTIAMIGNVSRTLETRWTAYKSLVRQGHDNSDNYVTDYFLSTSHKLDPLVAFRKFSPDKNWPESETIAEGRLAVIEPKIIAHYNVHDLPHYLNNPKVNVPLFRMLRHKLFISEQEQKDAEKAYENANPVEVFKEHGRKLESILSGETEFSWKNMVIVFKGFYKLVKDFIK